MTDMVINVDWFQAMVRGGLVREHPLEKYQYSAGAVVLKRNHKRGSKHFKYSYDVSVNGKEYGYIFCAPRNEAILNPHFIQFQVNNNVLYEVGWLDRYKMVINALDWESVNITRVDIALDGHGFFDTWRKFKSGVYDKKGKACYQEFSTGNRRLTGFDVGSRASSKWITCYNKTAELKKGNKHYIGDMWERAGLDTTSDVERLEVKLRNDAIKRITGFDWELLDDFEYLASVMRTQIVNLFDFTHSSKDTNVSRRKKVRAIAWNTIGGLLLPIDSTMASSEVWSMKVAAKRMFMIYLQTKKAHYAELAQEMAWNYNCLDWYKEHMEGWEKEFAFNGKFQKSEYLSIHFNRGERSVIFSFFHLLEMLNYFLVSGILRKSFLCIPSV